MASPVYMRKEWYGSILPSNITVPLPTAAELVSLCKETNRHGYTIGAPYPRGTEPPVFWIKYGPSIVWNELAGRKKAHDGLRNLESQVRAPAIYYACQVAIPYKDDPNGWPAHRTYVVMEYVPGRAAAQRLQDALDDDAMKDLIYAKIAFALSELHRIPVPQDSRPAAANGGRIRHELFDDNQASLHYRNIGELEQHLDLFLTMKKGQYRIENLAQEPMVFCYSDVWLDNFIIDDTDRIIVVNFEDVNILPSSFSKFILAGTRDKIGRDVRHMVVVPETEGVDNTSALIAVARPMMIGSGSFAKAGRKLLGYYTRDEDDVVDKTVTDAQGVPVYAFMEPSGPPDVPVPVSTPPFKQ
ncbi:uncharacterized protein TRUGW13939_04258 [Talaromyces rugulosus]|uniref:Aminoglycoside phosphotransferase domain-containing protein n=1 Tax=Talaromyces rugulosus TaxID=121627 RepID=A0A7H8QT44_TALRU|nr:uncharacterized protein TRUGW13939_04258 [Talaromyces rugulosus]QKX57150.1 hypothetical protein TRUGW13939_04258 [Talaromyces rugulosus]